LEGLLMEDDKRGTLDDEAFRGYQSVRTLLITGMLGGSVTVIVYAGQATSISQFVSIVSVGALLAGGSSTVGGLFGFLFGIPRTLQDGQGGTESEQGSSEQRRRPYVGNTSLEQISDWLTKILVGVGLTQLANIPTGLSALGSFVAPGLGGLTTAPVFAVVVAVYFAMVGFFLSYLWTRLYLPSLFAESDLRALIGTAEKRGEARAIEAISSAAGAAKVTGASDVEAAAGKLRALWVDDRPSNNQAEMELLGQVLGIEFDTRQSTSDALAALEGDPKRYSIVLTDMGRPGDRQAGYTLLKEMRDRGIDLPVIIYSRASSPDFAAEARRRGAVLATNSASELVEAVAEIALKRGRPHAANG
jgi:CheY-like chemotaxis protein